ncbi:Hypothetical protein PHPALM_8821 [Phytophthora palmivora]|uniref:Uncharacterized protein n=1 Tax=Phytophthora palmivora TaxID=4796 RepID=A0A2P4Y8X3_9STRA|nr:Hypothetical protein PHPALM_8821 [Phytophthora palmivora]
MVTDWSFLNPWRDALCSVLTPQESCLSRALARLTFTRHDGNPLSMITCMLVVNFPADEERRNNIELLQTVREAIEIFNMLAAVDKTAFVTLLPEFTDVVREIWDISDGPRLIRLVWDCTLVGQLSPSDPVASKHSVTWGELFGCPNDPWEYSEKFRDAMHRLEAMGLEDIGDWWGVLESIEYSAKDDGVPINGEQWIESGLAKIDPIV